MARACGAMTDLLYAAYGSNLDPQRLRGRCPGAAEAGTGWLQGWRLQMNRFATIVADPAARVPVAIWRIPEAQMTVLDSKEGYVRGRAGNSYDRFAVTVLGADGSGIACLTYREIKTTPDRDRPWKPEYLAHIRAGYAHFGLDASYLDAALAAPGRLRSA